MGLFVNSGGWYVSLRNDCGDAETWAEAGDVFLPWTAAELGDKCSARLLLADSSRQLLVPERHERRGLELLAMDGEL